MHPLQAAHADVTGKIREAVEAGAVKELPTGDSYAMLPGMRRVWGGGGRVRKALVEAWWRLL